MPADPRIERVARAICRAEDQDPDLPVFSCLWNEDGETVPNWRYFADEAAWCITAFDELRAIEREAEDAELLAAMERAAKSVTATLSAELVAALGSILAEER